MAASEKARNNSHILERVVASTALLLALFLFVGYLSVGNALFRTFGYTGSPLALLSYEEVVFSGAIQVYSEAIQQIPTLVVVWFLREWGPAKERTRLTYVLAALLTFSLVLYYAVPSVYLKRVLIAWFWAHTPAATVLTLGAAFFVTLEVWTRSIPGFTTTSRRRAGVIVLWMTLLPILAYRSPPYPVMTSARVVFSDNHSEDLWFLSLNGGAYFLGDTNKGELRIVNEAEVKQLYLLNREPKEAEDAFWRSVGAR